MSGAAVSGEEPLDLGGRVVLVTGGAGGLGRAMARALVASGARVVLADVAASGVGAFADELGPQALAVAADISTPEGVSAVVTASERAFGPVEVLVNNAGIGMGVVRAGDRYSRPIHLFEVEPEHLRAFFAVHVYAPFLLTKALAPQMVDRGFGRIVTVTTSLSTMIRPGNAPYGPMKAASEAFTAIAAGDLEGTGVTANILVPGGGADTAMVPEVAGRSRAGLVTPEKMGPPVVWLASDESAGATARRFLGRLWDPGLPRAEAAAAAAFPIAWPLETS
ncbi:MAG TPA: SDR family oxidoreductase [Acidimicrobiales bacterium]|nr:SDR family oxidoreductase [Acidimicrobiales bacterium]